ncbi:MAG: heme ABC exporter ATP-binding protein CcmA [Acetobacteraceae bacterium]
MQGETAAPGLAAQTISAFRGERLVLRDVSLAVPAGGAMLLLGPNGSGKSTLLRVLAGLKRPDAGRVTWYGQDIEEAPVAYLGHLDAVKPGLTVAENLAFAARFCDPAAALASMDLTALRDLPAMLLSAGQKRRVALARLAFTPAGLWLLDEPTLGLDAASVDRLGVVLAAHRAAGGVVVAATHLPLPLPDAAELRL